MNCSSNQTQTAKIKSSSRVVRTSPESPNESRVSTAAEVYRIARSYEGVVAASQPLSMYIGRHEVLLAMDLQFARHATASAVARTIDSIEQQIGRRFPAIKRVYIEAQLDLAPTAS